MTTIASSRVKEALLVAAIVLVAFAVRAWNISETTIDHFDEGVYAFSALGVSDPGQPRVMYPNQEIFSPPLYFGIAGIATRALGIAPDRALLMLSVLFGTLTVLAVWWITRSWFGPGAGLASSTLLALNPYHITFSRSALTDVTFTFFLLIAIAALVRAIEKESFRTAIWAGLATGLAWNTKYHGWFALLIAGAALVPYCWSLRQRGRGWQKLIMIWGTSSVVAFLCYLPWLLFLKSQPTGYQGMATHYLGMMRTDWLHNLTRYAERLYFFEGPLSRLAVLLALFVASFAARRSITGNWRFLSIFLLFSASSLLLGSVGVAALCAVVAIPFLASRESTFRQWTLLAWIAIWIAAAPVYHPYVRLVLPLVVAGFVVAGYVISRAVESASAELAVPVRQPLSKFALPVLMLPLVLLAMDLPSDARPWLVHRGVSSTVAEMAGQIPTGSRVIAVLEPPTAFYLHRLGRPAFERNGSFAVLDTLSTPAYVVTGGLVRRSKKLMSNLDQLSDKLIPLGTFPLRPYDVRVLDDLTAAGAHRYRAHPDTTFDLHLFKFVPAGK